jgi:hypothetical protein
MQFIISLIPTLLDEYNHGTEKGHLLVVIYWSNFVTEKDEDEEEEEEED